MIGKIAAKECAIIYQCVTTKPVMDEWWVLSSVWRALTYHSLLCYLQCVCHLVTTANGSTALRWLNKPKLSVK